MVKSDDQGLAFVDFILGAKVGENVIYAATPIAPDKGVTFSVMGVAGAGAQIVKHSGDEQVGRVNAPLAQQCVVWVMDVYDNPVSNASVSFSAIDGGAIAAPQTALTDSAGYTGATAICGPNVGQYTFKAELPNGVFVLFSASAEKSNNAPQIITYMPVENELTFSYNERIQFEITQAFDADNDPLYYYWHVNGQMVGNQPKLLLFMSQIFGPKNSLTCTVTDNQDSASVTWTLNLDTRVELSSFTATTVKKSTVLLQWTTASERDNRGFRILRSHFKDKDFEPIMDSLIKPNSTRSYQFTDTEQLQPGDYFYLLESIATSGRVMQHGPVSATIQTPAEFALLQNYPNPFNPTTTLAFELPTSTNVQLVIYNQKGQLVRRLVDNDMSPGFHTVIWDAKDAFGNQAPTGIYLYRLTAGEFSETKKLTLLK